MCWYKDENIVNDILDYSCTGITNQSTSDICENIKRILQSGGNLNGNIVRCFYCFPEDQNRPRHYAAERFFEILFDRDLLESETLTFAFVSLWTMRRPFEYFSQDKLRVIFNSVNKPMLDYGTCIDELEEQITIYRGIRSNALDNQNVGFSWTLDRNIAMNFATGDHRCEGIILSGEANKNDIIGYFKNRDEEEIVILPEQIRGIHSEYVR